MGCGDQKIFLNAIGQKSHVFLPNSCYIKLLYQSEKLSARSNKSIAITSKIARQTTLKRRRKDICVLTNRSNNYVPDWQFRAKLLKQTIYFSKIILISNKYSAEYTIVLQFSPFPQSKAVPLLLVYYKNA